MKINRRRGFAPSLIALLVASLMVGCGTKSESNPPTGAAKPGDAKPAGAPKSAAGPAAGGAAKPSGLPVKAEPVKVGLIENEISAVGTLLPGARSRQR